MIALVVTISLEIIVVENDVIEELLHGGGGVGEDNDHKCVLFVGHC